MESSLSPLERKLSTNTECDAKMLRVFRAKLLLLVSVDENELFDSDVVVLYELFFVEQLSIELLLDSVELRELGELVQLAKLAALGQRDIPTISLELHDDSDETGDPHT